MTERVKETGVGRKTLVKCVCSWQGLVLDMRMAPPDFIGVAYRSCPKCKAILVRTDMEGDLYIRENEAQVVEQHVRA